MNCVKDLEIGLLGPVEVHIEGLPICIARKKEKTLVAALALAPSHLESSDVLMDMIWSGNPPKSGLDTLQSMVSRLRGRLGTGRIESIDCCYRLVVDNECIDASRLERLTALASSSLAQDCAQATELAEQAIALWRGHPLSDLGDLPALAADIRRLEALYQTATEVRLEAYVACGRFAPAVAGLRAALVDNPFRERLWYLLVLGLAQDGCRVEALRACHELRTELGAIGLEPSRDMCELEQMILSEAPAVRSRLRR